MPVTHQEIADRAGVSRALVTRALHRTHGARVSQETRRLIFQVAREMGYRPRNVTTYNIGYVGKSETLFLVGESRFLLLSDKAAREEGFRLVLTSLEEKGEAGLNDVLNAKTVDGVIFSRWFGADVHNKLALNVPWLVVSSNDEIPATVDKVTMDSVLTTQHIADHMISYGHQHFCVLSNPSVGNVTTHMHIGIRRALEKANVAGMVYSIEVISDSEIAGQLKALMALPKAPTAFIVFGAEKSVTLLNVLNVYGYRVPQDISLASLLDGHILEPLIPSITATTAMGIEVAQQAVSRLLEKIKDPLSPAQHILLPGELIHRLSVGPVGQRKKN